MVQIQSHDKNQHGDIPGTGGGHGIVISSKLSAVLIASEISEQQFSWGKLVFIPLVDNLSAFLFCI